MNNPEREFLFQISRMADFRPCPEDAAWFLAGEGSTVICEAETVLMLYGMIRTLKPERVVETGCNIGITTMALAMALKENGSGRMWTCDVNEQFVVEAAKRCLDLPARFEVGDGESLIRAIGPDFAFIDSSYECRLREIKALPEGCIAVVHDTSLEPPLAEAVKAKGGLVFPGARGFGIVRA